MTFVAWLVSPTRDCGANAGASFDPPLAAFTHTEPQRAGVGSSFCGVGERDMVRGSAERYFTVLPSGFWNK